MCKARKWDQRSHDESLTVAGIHTKNLVGQPIVHQCPTIANPWICVHRNIP
jgi:hypothetical protein